MSATTVTSLPLKQPAPVRILAYLISYVFHPLFIPAYVTAYLLFIDPYAYAGLPHKIKVFRLIAVFFSTGFIPGFAVFLMRALKLIQSMHLATQKERIIPYAAAMIFYFWGWYSFHSLSDSPESIVNFLLGSFLAVCAAWFLNIMTKISMHAIAVGGAAMFFLLQSFSEADVTGMYFSLAVLVAGVVCTARFIVSDHTQAQIYGGLFAGALCQLIAIWVQ
jgi:hypothetical protein